LATYHRALLRLPFRNGWIDLMTSAVAALLILAATTLPAAAQTAPPKPKPATAAASTPAVQTPLDTAKAMTQAERQAIQSDLAWVGKYNGLINGEASDRMVGAIQAFQKDRRGKPTGTLNPQEREQLTQAARKLQASVGWKLVGDAATGMRTGLPAKLVPQQTSDANGTRWSAASGAVQVVLTRTKQADLTTAKIAEQQRAQPADRKITYSTVKPDFFVLSGTQGTGNFYLRGQVRGNEARILTILYDQASKAIMEPVVIAMSSAFNPFPSGAEALGPPPRKSVEYATGIVVSSAGDIVTDRQAIEGCQSIVIAGRGNADRIALDKQHDLALLRIYGAHGLTPLALGGAATSASLELTGIADPQSQGGGAAVSSVAASATLVGSNGELALAPAPGLGFSGAAARDASGKFAGMVQLKPVVVAGPASATPAAQAVLVPAATVRNFLAAQRVESNGTASDAKAAVVRVICVRK
jgi:hypothetical protein